MCPSWSLPENFEGAVGQWVTRGRCQACPLSSQTHSHVLHHRQDPGRSAQLPPGPSLTPPPPLRQFRDTREGRCPEPSTGSSQAVRGEALEYGQRAGLLPDLHPFHSHGQGKEGGKVTQRLASPRSAIGCL